MLLTPPVGYTDLGWFLSKRDLDRLAQNVQFNNTPAGPCYLEFHITNRCNSCCYFCNQSLSRSDRKELPVAEFEKIVAECTSSGLKIVRLSGGGEPTVHKGILKILDILRKHNIALARFDTNGICLTPELSQKLIEHDLGTLHFSLQAPTSRSWARSTHLSSRGFDRVLNNMATFLEYDDKKKVRVYASIALDEFTIDLLSEAIQLGHEFGIAMHFHSITSYKYSAVFLQKLAKFIRLSEMESARPEFAEYIPTLQRIYAEIDAQLNVSHNQIGLIPPQWSICAAPWVGAVIKPNGDLYQCCACQGPVLGNVLRDGMRHAWHGVTFERFRSEMHRVFVSQSKELWQKENSPNLVPPMCFQYCPVRKSMFCHPYFEPESKTKQMISSGVDPEKEL